LNGIKERRVEMTMLKETVHSATCHSPNLRSMSHTGFSSRDNLASYWVMDFNIEAVIGAKLLQNSHWPVERGIGRRLGRCGWMGPHRRYRSRMS
jgi:hypothetical protein